MDRLLARFSNSRPSCNPSALPYLSQPIHGQLEHHTDHDHHQWSFEENKIFENALAEFDFPSPDLFEKIATRIPRKTLPQIKQHFEALLKDIQMIESGLVPVPDYDGDHNDNTTTSDNISAPIIDNKFQHAKRRKGKPWSEREHELFLQGLEKFGKGDWRSISRHCVVTKNPTQVASHAQKYFLRLQNSAARQNVGSTTRWSNKPSTSKDALMSSTASSSHLSLPYVVSSGY